MNFPNYSRKKAIAVITAIVIGLFCAYLFSNPKKVFINHWISEFKQVDSYPKALSLHESGKAFARKFPSGEWIVATCEHSCCSGAGFDVTVIRDSTGAIYVDTDYCFCGMAEAMSATFSGVNADSLATFYPQLKMLHLARR